MVPPLDATAALLRAALEEALAVEEEQQVQVEKARKQADISGERLDEMLACMQRGEAPSQPLMPGFANPDEVLADARKTQELSARWDRALSDVDLAVMRLYAYPEARPHAENIAAAIRDLRLLALDYSVDDALPFPQEVSPAEELPHDPSELRRMRAGILGRFFETSEPYVQKTVKELEGKGWRQHELLEAALTEARKLTELVRYLNAPRSKTGKHTLRCIRRREHLAGGPQ